MNSLLSVLIVVGLSSAIGGPIFHSVGKPNRVIKNPKANTCTLVCLIEEVDNRTIEKKLSKEWKRADFKDIKDFNVTEPTYYRLDDIFWIKQKKIHYRPSKSDCGSIKTKDENVTRYSYDCSYTLPCNKIFEAQYRCIVYAEGDPVETVDVMYGDPPQDLPIVCTQPDATNIFASIHAGEIRVEWDLLFESDTNKCNYSEFHVQVLGYDSYQDYLVNIYPVYFLEYEATPIEQGTFFNTEFRPGMYYAFDVRNERKKIYSENPFVQSEVFYFDQQEEASVVYPEEDTLSIVAHDGETVELRCEGRGMPAPDVALIRPTNTRATDSESSDPLVIQKTIIATRETEGDYHCTAAGVYVHREGGAKYSFDFKTISLSVITILNSDRSFGESLTCARIAHSECSPYISNRDVLFNTTGTVPEVRGLFLSLDLQVQLRSGLGNSSLLSSCVDLAKAMVCHSKFPSCHVHTLTTSKICKNTCAMFGPGGACENVIDPIVLQGAMVTESCDDRDSPAGSTPECIHVPFGDVSLDGSWCSRGNGHDYSGSVTSTQSGIVCQEWFSQSPHRHPGYSAEELYVADRECRNPGGRGLRPWCYTSDAFSRWEYCDVPQCSACEDYTGEFCRGLSGYTGSVFVDRHASQWGERGELSAEGFMLGTFVGLTGSSSFTMLSKCELYLRELLCHSTLPPCSSQKGSPTPLKMCSGHCRLKELLQICPSNLLENLKKERLFSERMFYEPDCDLPETNETCIAVQSIQELLLENTNYESCYNTSDDGITYTGKISETVEGVTCQFWGNDLLEINNYCRNLGGVRSKPWCFTDRETSEWDYCDIPACIESTPSTITKMSLSSTTRGLIALFVIIGIVLIVVSLIAAIIMCCLYKKREEIVATDNLALEKLQNKQKWDYVINETYVKVTSAPEKVKEAIENFPQIPKSTIAYKRQIGQGNFGVVFYAKAEGLVDDEKETEVAVKTLKEDTTGEAVDDFVREAKLMFSFDHPNIVKIFGVCMENMPYYLVFEYMDKGDLTQFLRANASSLQRRMMNPFDEHRRSRTESTLSDEPPSLSVEQLIDMCKQIAGGMDYLAELNHVHRDLACRNCLVKSCDWAQTGSGLIIKIGDFGMSQNLYSSDYYRVRGQAVLPVRWMSPEAVIYGKFSTESDVWSFGVVMWEVFSFAMQPYYGTSNEEVTEAIRRHKILIKPSECPNTIYDIMKLCWTQVPKDRPTFAELYCLLSDCRLSVSSSERSDDYCNDNCSDLDSDAFLEENSVAELDAVIA